MGIMAGSNNDHLPTLILNTAIEYAWWAFLFFVSQRIIPDITFIYEFETNGKV